MLPRPCIKIYPTLNEPGKGIYVFNFSLNERAVLLDTANLKCAWHCRLRKSILIPRTIIAILLLANLTTQATTPKIIIGEAKEINYVTHLYTLAGIGGEDADVKYFENADVHTLMEIYSSLEKEGITDIPTLYRTAIARYISRLE